MKEEIKFVKIEKNFWSRYVEGAAILNSVLFLAYTVISLCMHRFHLGVCLIFFAYALFCIWSHLRLKKMRDESNAFLEKCAKEMNEWNKLVESHENQKEEK